MFERGAYGDRLASCFGAPVAPTLATVPLNNAPFAITRLECFVGEGGRSIFIPAEDAYFVMLYLRDATHCDIWEGRPPGPFKLYPKDTICLISLAEGAGVFLASDLHALAFYLPRDLLDEMTDQANEPRVKELLCKRGEADPVLHLLGAALLPLFELPEESRETIDHLALAISAHLVHRYGHLQA